MNASLATVHAIGEYTDAIYIAERDAIRATYGDNNAEAGALRDQALAELFYRTGWTQERLAKVEGCTQQSAARRLRFGRFLAFTPTGSNSPNVPRNLSERRFRRYWERTDPKENDRQRFLAVIKELNSAVPSAPRRDGLGRAILEKFGDNKWHKLEVIAAHVNQPPESLVEFLANLGCRDNRVALCERKTVGKKDGTSAYRIVRRRGDSIDLAALTSELEPILEEMEYQGAQHRAAYSPSAVLQCAHRIRNLLQTLAQQAAPSR